MTTETAEATQAMHNRLQELTALKEERLTEFDQLRATEANLTEQLKRLRKSIKAAGVTLKIKRDPTPNNTETDRTLTWCRTNHPEPAGTGTQRLQAIIKEIDQHKLNQRNTA